jgi:hypothetical protein
LIIEVLVDALYLERDRLYFIAEELRCKSVVVISQEAILLLLSHLVSHFDDSSNENSEFLEPLERSLKVLEIGFVIFFRVIWVFQIEELTREKLTPDVVVFFQFEIRMHLPV